MLPVEIKSAVASSYRAFLSAYPSAPRGAESPTGCLVPETGGDPWPRTTPKMWHLKSWGRRSALPHCHCFVVVAFFSYISSHTHLRALLCGAYPAKAQWAVGMCLCLLFSSARESLGLRFWGTSTCLPARSRCAQAGGSLNGPSRRLPAPIHADVPVSFGSAAQRGQKGFSQRRNHPQCFLHMRTEQWATWVTDRHRMNLAHWSK